MEEKRHRGSLIGPAILIGLGVVLLLNNLGLLAWGVWETLFRLWPVLLVAVGLDLLVGRRSWLGSVLAAALVLAVLAGAVWLFASRPATGETISQPLGDADNATVKIAFGAGRLTVGALNDSKNLVEGTVDLGQGERVVQDYDVSSGTAHYELRSTGVPFVPPFDRGRYTWAIKLNSAVPLTLDVDTGVGQAVLDLSDLNVTEVRLNTGVGQTRLTLPAAGDVQAEVHGGIGELTIVIPVGMAARIHAQSGIGQVSVIGDYERDGRTYTSPGFASAENRVELTVTGGVGSIRVEMDKP